MQVQHREDPMKVDFPNVEDMPQVAGLAYGLYLDIRKIKWKV